MVITLKHKQLFCMALISVFLCALLAIATDAVKVNAATQEKKTPLPIVMYHKLTTDETKTGPYVTTVAQFEKDLQYLQKQGYETISVVQLLCFAYNGGELPKKPVMITFDDGFECIAAYAAPLLEQYGMCAVNFVIGCVADDYSCQSLHELAYSCLNWETAKALADSGTLELQSHSYDLHRIAMGRTGAAKMQTETAEDYAKMLSQDCIQMRTKMRENTGYEPTALAYPYGSWSEESAQILQDNGILAAFTCEERVNYIHTQSTEWLYRLRRYNRAHGKSSEAFFEKMGIGKAV